MLRAPDAGANSATSAAVRTLCGTRTNLALWPSRVLRRSTKLIVRHLDCWPQSFGWRGRF